MFAQSLAIGFGLLLTFGVILGSIVTATPAKAGACNASTLASCAKQRHSSLEATEAR